MKQWILYILAAVLLLMPGCAHKQNEAEPQSSPEAVAITEEPPEEGGELSPSSLPAPTPVQPAGVDKTVEIDSFDITDMTVDSEEMRWLAYETYDRFVDAVGLSICADHIIVGEVTSVEFTDNDADANTYYCFSVEESWKGELNPQDTITVLQFGGYVRSSGNHLTKYTVYGAPMTEAGDKCVLFLNSRPDGTYAPCGDICGRYFIDGDLANRRIPENMQNFLYYYDWTQNDPIAVDDLKRIVGDVVENPRIYYPEVTLDQYRTSFISGTEAISSQPGAEAVVEERNELLSFYDTLMDKLEEIAASETYHPTMLFLGEETSLSIYNGNTLESSIMKTAGGVNVAWEIANWYTGSTYGITEVTLDQLIAWDPEIIYCPAGARYAVSDILKDPAWQSLRAVRNGKVFQVLSRPRSSLGGCLSVAWIVNNIYPERYTDKQRSADAKQFYAFDYRS